MIHLLLLYVLHSVGGQRLCFGWLKLILKISEKLLKSPVDRSLKSVCESFFIKYIYIYILDARKLPHGLRESVADISANYIHKWGKM